MELDSSEFVISVNKHLDRIKDDIYDEVIKAATETRNEAVRRTPVDTGALRSAWQMRVSRGVNTLEAIVKNDTKYVRAIEYGTKPHTIRAKNKKVLADKKTNSVFGAKVRHPGTKAKPMIRPALAKVLPKLKDRIRRLGS